MSRLTQFRETNKGFFITCQTTFLEVWYEGIVGVIGNKLTMELSNPKVQPHYVYGGMIGVSSWFPGKIITRDFKKFYNIRYGRFIDCVTGLTALDKMMIRALKRPVKLLDGEDCPKEGKE
jgi:hypothetical protein